MYLCNLFTFECSSVSLNLLLNKVLKIQSWILCSFGEIFTTRDWGWVSPFCLQGITWQFWTTKIVFYHLFVKRCQDGKNNKLASAWLQRFRKRYRYFYKILDKEKSQLSVSHKNMYKAHFPRVSFVEMKYRARRRQSGGRSEAGIFPTQRWASLLWRTSPSLHSWIFV